MTLDPPRTRGWVHDRVLPEGRWRAAPEVLVELLAGYDRGTPADNPTGNVADRGLVMIPRRAARRMNSTMRDVARGNEDRAVWLHPDDAAAIVGTDHQNGVVDGDQVVVTSATGSIEGTVRVTADVVPGAVSLPHGLADQNVNRLTSGAPGHVDPFTAMVTQSGIAVTVHRIERRPAAAVIS
jgi:anaerobic selenocysteine-containing dehydrogenase